MSRKTQAAQAQFLALSAVMAAVRLREPEKAEVMRKALVEEFQKDVNYEFANTEIKMPKVPFECEKKAEMLVDTFIPESVGEASYSGIEMLGQSFGISVDKVAEMTDEQIEKFGNEVCEKDEWKPAAQCPIDKIWSIPVYQRLDMQDVVKRNLSETHKLPNAVLNHRTEGIVFHDPDKFVAKTLMRGAIMPLRRAYFADTRRLMEKPDGPGWLVNLARMGVGTLQRGQVDSHFRRVYPTGDYAEYMRQRTGGMVKDDGLQLVYLGFRLSECCSTFHQMTSYIDDVVGPQGYGHGVVIVLYDPTPPGSPAMILERYRKNETDQYVRENIQSGNSNYAAYRIPLAHVCQYALDRGMTCEFLAPQQLGLRDKAIRVVIVKPDPAALFRMAPGDVKIHGHVTISPVDYNDLVSIVENNACVVTGDWEQSGVAMYTAGDRACIVTYLCDEEDTVTGTYVDCCYWDHKQHQVLNGNWIQRHDAFRTLQMSSYDVEWLHGKPPPISFRVELAPLFKTLEDATSCFIITPRRNYFATHPHMGLPRATTVYCGRMSARTESAEADDMIEVYRTDEPAILVPKLSLRVDPLEWVGMINREQISFSQFRAAFRPTDFEILKTLDIVPPGSSVAGNEEVKKRLVASWPYPLRDDSETQEYSKRMLYHRAVLIRQAMDGRLDLDVSATLVMNEVLKAAAVRLARVVRTAAKKAKRVEQEYEFEGQAPPPDDDEPYQGTSPSGM